MKLDDKGRCPNCLRKPLSYRREGHWFCHTCCRQYSMSTGDQQPNWAWEIVAGEWKSIYPDDGNHHYMNAKPTAAALRRDGAMTDHPCKGLSKAAIAAFEQIAINQPPECSWKTLDTLMNNALIDRSEDTVKHVPGGIYRVPNYFVPVAVHAQWCVWCSEQPENAE